jgi:hypothetical protein
MPAKAIQEKRRGEQKEKQEDNPKREDLVYSPDEHAQEVIMEEYTDIQTMIDRRNNTYEEFGVRTLKPFVDENDKQLNARVVDKGSYDPPKEEWQSNVPLPVIRDKQEKILAGYSLDVPDMETTSTVTDGSLDITDRAYICKWLIKGSYMQEENSVIENFWEAWEAAARGTVIKYEGYLKTRAKQKFITGYDAIEGRVEFVESEVDIDDKCVSYLLPIFEFYPWDYSINDVQEQPKLAWIRYMDKGAFDFEFGRYKDAAKVKYKSEMVNISQEGFYGKQRWWMDRVEDNQIEVVCTYTKHKGKTYDSYRIIANGVLILDAPLLWKKNGVKIYPFAKTIFKPFVNKHFFYGNSCPNVLAALCDSLNTTLNTMSDKQWRSMIPGMLVGRVNADSFDLEDQYMTSTTRVPVADVNQVKPIPVEGINNGDILFFNLLSGMINDFAPSLPALLGNKQATAREIVIANEKIDELKTIYHAMMADLWRQKYVIRLANIQLNYPQPRTITDSTTKEATKTYRTYLISDAELDSNTGERGTLAIKFMPLDKETKAKEAKESAIQEEIFKQKGINYKRIVCTTDYLDNSSIQITIVPGSVYRASMAKEQALVLEKIETVSKYFADIFVVNKKEYFQQWSKAYNDNPGKYLQKLQEFEDAKQKLMDAAAGQGAPGAAGAGKPALTPGKAPNVAPAAPVAQPTAA